MITMSTALTSIMKSWVATADTSPQSNLAQIAYVDGNSTNGACVNLRSLQMRPDYLIRKKLNSRNQRQIVIGETGCTSYSVLINHNNRQ